MSEKCSTCLSKAENLSSISKENSIILFNVISPNKYAFLEGIEICWKCQETLQGICTFRDTAVRSLEHMSEYYDTSSQSTEAEPWTGIPAEDSDHNYFKTEKLVKDDQAISNENAINKLANCSVTIVRCAKELKRPVQEDNDSSNLDTSSKKKIRSDVDTPKESSEEVPVPIHPAAPHWYIKVLSREQILDKMNQKRCSSQFAAAPHKCAPCAIPFKDKVALEDHVVACHSKNIGTYSCYICTRQFRARAQMTRHMALHCTQVYVCAGCHRETCDLREIQAHHCGAMPRHAPANPKPKKKPRVSTVGFVKCTLCSMTVKKTGIWSHINRRHKPTEPMKCEICDRTLKNQFTLKQHMKQLHSDTPQQQGTEKQYCKPCDHWFSSMHSYNFHLKTSLKHVDRDQFKYECEQCGLKFFYPKQLNEHRNVVHLNQRPYECDRCDKTFTSSRSVRRHVHSAHEHRVPARNHVCEMCGSAFAEKQILKSHIRSHTGERPYKCKLCPSTFGYSGALYTHNKLVHEKVKRLGKKKVTRKESSEPNEPSVI